MNETKDRLVVERIDNVQILKEKILKIDTIFALIGEKQSKIGALESKCKRYLRENAQLSSQMDELLGEIAKKETSHAKVVVEFEGKIVEELHRFTELEVQLQKTKLASRAKINKTIATCRCILSRRVRENGKRYACYIQKLRRTIRGLSKGGDKSDDNIYELLNEMVTMLPQQIVEPFADTPAPAACMISTQTQTTHITRVTRPVQTDAQTGSADVERKSMHAQTDQLPTHIMCSKQTQTDCVPQVKLQPMITLKHAVEALKRSKATFSISNGTLIHYSKQPLTVSQDSLIAKSIFRCLAKYCKQQHLKVKARKQQQRAKQLQLRAAFQSNSDTESSGYESRHCKRRRLARRAPSSNSGVLSDGHDSRAEEEAMTVAEIFNQVLPIPPMISPLTTLSTAHEEEPMTKCSNSKRPRDRLAMLRKRIKKCNQVPLRPQPQLTTTIAPTAQSTCEHEKEAKTNETAHSILLDKSEIDKEYLRIKRKCMDKTTDSNSTTSDILKRLANIEEQQSTENTQAADVVQEQQPLPSNNSSILVQVKVDEPPIEANHSDAQSESVEEEDEESEEHAVTVTYRRARTAFNSLISMKGNTKAYSEHVDVLARMDDVKFANFLIQYVKRDKSEGETESVAPGDPVLTVAQKVLIGIMLRFERERDRTHLIEMTIKYIEKYLLYNEQRVLLSIESLSRFYTALCRMRQKKSHVRMFIGDVLYVRPPNMFLIIDSILSSWLSVLTPYSEGSQRVDIDHVLVYVVHTNNIKNGLEKADRLAKLLSTCYHFPSTTPSADDLFKSLIHSYMCGSHVQDEVAILIICIHAEAHFTYEQVLFIGELCIVSQNEKVVRNLVKLIGKMRQKLPFDFKSKLHQFGCQLIQRLEDEKQLNCFEDIKQLYFTDK